MPVSFSKALSAAALLFFSVLSSGGIAHASNLLPPDPGEGTPFMTLENSTAMKTTFGWDETPFVFSYFPEIEPGERLRVSWVWKYEGHKEAQAHETYADLTSLSSWHSLSGWESIRAAGDWSVVTKWKYQGSRYTESARSYFTVTPEPFSAALFLIGGLAISARKFFRKGAKAEARSQK